MSDRTNAGREVPDAAGSATTLAFLAALALLAAARIAALASSPLGLQADEAQYWAWAQSPAFGYFSKPPMVAWAIAATTGLFGDAPAMVRLAAPLAHVVTAFLVYLLASRLYGARVGLWAGAVFATLPGVFFSAMIMSTDALLLPFWALALIAFERATATGGRGWWGLVGIAVGFGLLAKYAMAYFVLGAVVYLVWNREARWSLKGWRWIWALVPAAGIFAPNLAWNAAHRWASFSHTAANANLGGRLFNPGELGEFVLSQLAVFGPLTALAFLCALAGLGRDARPRTRLLLSFSAPVLVLMMGQAFISRAHANWAATAYVAATILAVAWLVDGSWRRWLWAAAGIHAALGAFFLAVVAMGTLPGLAPTVKRDPFKALRGWDRLAEAVKAAEDAYPGAIVVADEREQLVQLMYLRRPDGLGFRKWNPGGGIHDHFDLFAGVERDVGRDLILVSRAEEGTPFARYGDRLVPLGQVETRPYADHRGTYRLWLLERFTGY
jgi:4-amino-4-deoxy-L-arabinose transferase-like glycosyltransferase